MPTLAQQFREEYKEEFLETLGPQLKEEGMKIGVEKGERNNAVETAMRMLNKGFDIDTIMELTGLGKEEISKLSSSTTH